MAWGKRPADPSPVKPLGAAGRGEHWWPVALAVLAVVGMHVALPAKYRINPPWAAPAVLLVLLAILIIGDPGRIDRQKPWLRTTTSVMIGFLTLANLFSAGRLVAAIITVNKLFADNALARRSYERQRWTPDGARAVEDFDGRPLTELRYGRALP